MSDLRQELENVLHDELLRHTSDYRFAEEVALRLTEVVLPICERERTDGRDSGVRDAVGGIASTLDLADLTGNDWRPAMQQIEDAARAQVRDYQAEGRTEALREVADDLATEAALLRMGPGDKIRRTTLNVAAKKIRRKIRAALSDKAEQ